MQLGRTTELGKSKHTHTHTLVHSTLTAVLFLANTQIPTQLRNLSLGQIKTHLKVSNQLPRSGTSALCTAGAPGFPSLASGGGHASPSAGAGAGTGQKGHWSWNRYDRFPREPPLKQVT